MTPGEFIEAFDIVAEAPGGIERLRELVLQLAVRGKLVPQDERDGEGEALLSLLKKARIKGKIARRIRKQKDDYTFSDRYVDIPQNWTWARLYEIGQTQTGTSPSSNNADLFGDYIPFIKPGNMGGVEINYDGSGLSKEGIKHSRFVPANSILMVCIGATLGKVNKTTQSVCFNQQINSLTTYLDIDTLADYIALALKFPGFRKLAWSKAGTGTLPIISKSKWEVLPIPLPPLKEQHRIVAKVNELMVLIDRLAVARRSREAVRTAARDSALAALRNASTSEDVEAAWTRIAERMDDLFTAPADLAPLREAVLQLAVRGRLVSQDEEEEPAALLLDRIVEERAKLVKEKKIRASKPLSTVSQHEASFEIPQSWMWIRLGSLCHLEMGQSPSSQFYNQNGDGLPFYQGKADFGDRCPTVRYWCTKPTKLADRGDVLLSVRAPIGPTNIATECCCIGRGLAALRPLAGMPTEYLLWALRAFEKQLDSMGTGTTFKAVSRKLLESFPLPLPPLVEQHRIVAKVDELMELIDWLEQHLVAKEEYHEAFAAAINQCEGME